MYKRQVAILCCACIFAASMTSEANRTYLINNIRVWSGNDTRTVIDNNEKNETVNMKEYEAIEEIEEKLDIDMPEFYYRPKGFDFLKYEVNQAADIARVESVSYTHLTSKQPLSVLYEEKKFRIRDLQMVFGGFVNVMEELTEFLMNPEQLILRPEYIYLDIESQKVYFCCLPGFHREIQEQMCIRDSVYAGWKGTR